MRVLALVLLASQSCSALLAPFRIARLSRHAATTTDSQTPEGDVDLDKLAQESASTTTFASSVDLSDMMVKGPREVPRQAEWFPFLLSPSTLDGTMAGDVGFDPLGFAKTKVDLTRMREAEIKHARLAMLAAAGWPMSELWHKELADTLGLESILASSDRAPSILNGGLSNEWIMGAGIFSLVIGGLLEAKAFEASKKENYKPGDYGFDPLRLYTLRVSFALDKIAENLTREQKISAAKRDMELCEIKNGRAAMYVGFLFSHPDLPPSLTIILHALSISQARHRSRRSTRVYIGDARCAANAFLLWRPHGLKIIFEFES